MMKILKKADEILALVLRWVVIVLCCAIGIILFIRVFTRYIPALCNLVGLPAPAFSTAWTDEVVEWMMAWMIFTAATLIMRNSDHFKVDLLQAKFEGKKWVNALNIFLLLISTAFIVSLLYYSWQLTAWVIWFTPILKVTMKVPYASMPVNCALMILYLIRDLVREFKALAGRRSPANSPDGGKEE